MENSSASLERRLYEGRHVVPSEKFRESLKAFLFSHMGEANEAWILPLARKIGEQEDLTHIRDILWENIGTQKEYEEQREALNPLALLKKPKIQKGITAILLITILIFGGGKFILGTQTVGTHETSVVSTSEEAFLLQGSIREQLTTSANLLEGDTFSTKEDTATISFFDGTLLHMGKNTSLILQRNIPHPSFPDTGEIDLLLEEGQIWIQTNSTSNQSAGVSIIAGDIVVIPEAATADITKEGNTVMVRIWERSVNILDRKSQKRGIFIAGMKARFSLVEEPMVESIQGQDESEEWIRGSKNIENQYSIASRKEILDSYKNQTGVLPGSIFYLIKRSLEKGKELSNNPEKQFQNIEKRFQEAFLLSEKSRGDLVQKTLAEGVTSLQSLLRESPEFKPFALHLFTKLKKELAFFAGDLRYTEIQKVVTASEAEVFSEDPIFLHQNILESLWSIQYTFTENKNYVPKDEFARYTAQKELLRNAVAKTPEQKRSLLQIKIQELRLLNFLFTRLFAKRDIESGEERVIEEVLSLTEEQENVAHLLWNPKAFSKSENPVLIFAEKVGIYETLQGKKNQIVQLLREIEDTPRSLPLLHEIRKELNDELRDTLTEKMIDIIEIELQQTLLATN